MRYQNLITCSIICASATSFAQNTDLQQRRECVIKNGVPAEITIQYNTKTAEKTIVVNGKSVPFEKAYPTGKEYAKNQSWYKNNEPINYRGKTFIRLGEWPKVYGLTELTPVEAYKDVATFVEKGDTGTTFLIYLAVQPGCEFHSYELQESTARSYAEKGMKQAKDKDIYGAITSFTHSIRKAPDSSIFWFYRGTAYSMANNTYYAESDFEKALKLNPKNYMIYLNRGLMYVRNKEKPNRFSYGVGKCVRHLVPV